MTGCLALALAAACGSGDAARDGASTRLPMAPPLVVGATAPIYDAAALDSSALHLGGAASDAVLLNVWATWCTSCREEFAELEAMRAKYGAQGLRVVAVSVDQGSDLKVRRFVSRQGSRFPVSHDREAKISALYGVRGLPATYLIGRDGTVKWTLTGSFLTDSAGLRKAIETEIAIENRG